MRIVLGFFFVSDDFLSTISSTVVRDDSLFASFPHNVATSFITGPSFLLATFNRSGTLAYMDSII